MEESGRNSLYSAALKNLRSQPAPYTVLVVVIIFCSWGLMTLPSEHRIYPLVATILVVAPVLVLLFRQEKIATQQSSSVSQETPQGESRAAAISIDGYWEMRDWRNDFGYRYPSLLKCKKKEAAARARTTCEDVEITQDESSASCKFSHRDEDNKMVNYKLEGEIKDLVFTGTWREVGDNPGDTAWFGRFQFIIEKNRGGGEKIMLGRWVGTNSNEESINCGVWEWRQRSVQGKRSGRDWPSEDNANSLDILRERAPDISDFTEANNEEPRPEGYDDFFWERLGLYPETKVLFEKADCKWDRLPSPHKEICIWHHNEAMAALRKEDLDEA